MTRPPFHPNPPAPDVSRLSERAYNAETSALSSLLDDMGMAAQAVHFAENRAARLIDRVGEKLEPATFDDVVTAIPMEQCQALAARLRDAVADADASDLVMPLVDAAREVEEDVTTLLEKIGREL